MAVLPSNIFFQKLDEFQTIIVFGHEKPDGDAYGSAMGLKLAIDMLYPGKTTYAVLGDVFGIPARLPKPTKPNTIPLDVIQNALCITVDTPSLARLGDKRALQGKYVIKIDHHPLIEHFGNVELVDENKAANSLIVANLLFEQFPVIPPLAAECLLLGIITDTGNFRFTADPASFTTAGRLLADGANLHEIYDAVYSKSLADLAIQGHVLSNVKVKGKLVYEVFSSDELKALNRNADEIAPRVNLIGGTTECPVWAYFCQYEDGTYRAEFRCSNDYDVSGVAVKVGGGGHQQASGATLANLDKVNEAIDLLSQLTPIHP